MTPEILRNLEAHYGLDKPLWRQYADYLGSLAKGDLGPSFKYPNRTVNEIIADKLPVSAELGALAILLALVLGIFYFVILLPMKRKQQKVQEFLDSLKVGDRIQFGHEGRVCFAGELFATVTEKVRHTDAVESRMNARTSSGSSAHSGASR